MPDPYAVETLAILLRDSRWRGNAKTEWRALPEKLREEFRDQARWILERFELVAKDA